MENKRTVVVKFEDAIALLKEYAEMVADDTEKVAEINQSIEDMEDRKEKAVKKNSGEKKESASALAKPRLGKLILGAMDENKGYKAGQLYDMHLSNELTSTSKVTNILTYLKNEGLVENYKEKGVSLYKKVVG